MKKKILFIIILCISSLKCHASTDIEKHIDNNQFIYNKDSPIRTVEVNNHNGMKTWMPYTLFNKISNQYKLQTYAKTDIHGFREIDGRYLVAVGTGVNVPVGGYIDIYLSNGEIIPAIIGDIKADADTDSKHITTVSSGCVCEFIVDKASLTSIITLMGDVSYQYDEWQSPIVAFKVYDSLNYLEEK